MSSPPNQRIRLGPVSFEIPGRRFSVEFPELRLPAEGLARVDAFLRLSAGRDKRFRDDIIETVRGHFLEEVRSAYVVAEGETPTISFESARLGELELVTFQFTGELIVQPSAFRPPELNHNLVDHRHRRTLGRSDWGGLTLNLEGPAAVLDHWSTSIEALLRSARPCERTGVAEEPHYGPPLNEENARDGVAFRIPRDWSEVPTRPRTSGCFPIGVDEDGTRVFFHANFEDREEWTTQGHLDFWHFRFTQKFWSEDSEGLAEPSIRTREIRGSKATTLEIHGTENPAPWTPGIATASRARWSGIVEAGTGTLELSLDGSSGLIDRWRATLEAILESIEIDREWQPPTPPRPTHVRAGDRIDVGGATIVVPSGWLLEMPDHVKPHGGDLFYTALFRLPAKGAQDAMIKFTAMPYSIRRRLPGPGRACSRYRADDGTPAEVKIEEREIGGVSVQSAAAFGTFVDLMAPDGIPDRGLLISHWKTPDHHVIVSLTGPEETVTHWRGSFEAMLDSIEAVEGETR